MQAPIVIDNVSRSYGGPPVLDGLSLSVEPGCIYGFLGRNGAGKTTLIRMLGGLIKPAAGEVRIMGQDPFTMSAEERQSLGYMSEKTAIPPFTKIRSLLELGRTFYPSWDSSLVDALLAKYELSPKNRFSLLSQGKQRLVNFIMAIAPRPRVLLLDEPAANLDVVARREILDDILELIREKECTVFFSTHILSDVERVADQIGILAKGRLCVSESLDFLKDSIRQVRFFGFPHGMPEGHVVESLRTVRGRDELVLTMRINGPITPEILARRWSCLHEVRTLNLEDIFVELSRA